MRRYAAEVETLRITPGTDFMERANQALLYWAWQRMLSPDGPLSGVSIFISTSEAPGEGEVKLLEWVLRQRVVGKNGGFGESILVLGAFHCRNFKIQSRIAETTWLHMAGLMIQTNSGLRNMVGLWKNQPSFCHQEDTW